MGIELPTVEIRFENIHIETALYTDTGRNLPTILNSYRAALEVRPLNAIRNFHRAGPVQSTVLGTSTGHLPPTCWANLIP